MTNESHFTVLITCPDGRIERRTRVFVGADMVLCQNVEVPKGKRTSEWIVKGLNDYSLRNIFADKMEYVRPLLAPCPGNADKELALLYKTLMHDCEKAYDFASFVACLELNPFLMRLGSNAGGHIVEVKRTWLGHLEPIRDTIAESLFELSRKLNLPKLAKVRR